MTLHQLLDNSKLRLFFGILGMLLGIVYAYKLGFHWVFGYLTYHSWARAFHDFGQAPWEFWLDQGLMALSALYLLIGGIGFLQKKVWGLRLFLFSCLFGMFEMPLGDYARFAILKQSILQESALASRSYVLPYGVLIGMGLFLAAFLIMCHKSFKASFYER